MTDVHRQLLSVLLIRIRFVEYWKLSEKVPHGFKMPIPRKCLHWRPLVILRIKFSSFPVLLSFTNRLRLQQPKPDTGGQRGEEVHGT